MFGVPRLRGRLKAELQTIQSADKSAHSKKTIKTRFFRGVMEFDLA